ncbi:MAG: hypothetical protein A2X13_13950 [Bacteroidetes bacterium GWC2_33_15]|nr:MAG: hypothetical protein A2X10_09165 [Bacteroidetes bacterium GWA2_33_15]OFX50448.1 MAG: hypothetical protein A2X13_13950 [Bacteroidetes bacterium GWC2_33_15]OFX66634.1 MAG: hypothetical protein A2X15_07925 [Bacteroidetes bacterium GWB2_32_14]OFX69252.1 MAG: hypothetical protein A2X14_08855 [Bacteroidetes bacterium GWD2_33_33]HAN18565.1 hypothetical protein [Bacteroidales bacterium]
MDIFFKNNFNEESITPPDEVTEHFFSYFSNPLNIEWYIENNSYEAIFYEYEYEKIASYDQKGNLIHVKTNIPVEQLPQKIFEIADSFGEIMNAIIIDEDSETFYEIIFRDKELTRFDLLLDQNGKILNKQKL